MKKDYKFEREQGVSYGKVLRKKEKHTHTHTHMPTFVNRDHPFVSWPLRPK